MYAQKDFFFFYKVPHHKFGAEESYQMNTLGALAASLALVSFLVYKAESKEYEVHTTGIILITGASSGIGRDAAEYLAKHFNFLVLAGVRKQSDYDKILQLNHKNLLPFIIDVSSHESCVNAAAKLSTLMDEHNLPFVGLVNNAGIGTFNPLEFQELIEARTLFDTNVFGLMDITQLTLPLLRRSKGRVINLSSLSGIVSTQFTGVYSASKYAVEALSDALRREVAHHGVSVSMIEPGYVKTELMKSAMVSPTTGERVEPMSDELLSLYPEAKKRHNMPAMMERMPGPETTTTPAIVHAMTSAFPKTRYPVAQANGLKAVVVSWLVWLFSDRIKDKLFK